MSVADEELQVTTAKEDTLGCVVGCGVPAFYVKGPGKLGGGGKWAIRPLIWRRIVNINVKRPRPKPFGHLDLNKARFSSQQVNCLFNRCR